MPKANPTRCPHCGAPISTSLIPAAHHWFYCPRCRSELEVAPSDPLPILLVSLVLAIGVCFVLGLRGFALLAGIGVATATMFYGGEFISSFVMPPKLRLRSAQPHTIARIRSGSHFASSLSHRSRTSICDAFMSRNAKPIPSPGTVRTTDARVSNVISSCSIRSCTTIPTSNESWART